MEINDIPTLEELEHMTDEDVEKLVHPDHEVMYIAEIVKQRGDKKSDVLPTGFSRLDQAMQGGLRGGDLMVISGVSGEGKTSLSQTITYNQTKSGIPHLWFSYEVSIEHLHRKFTEMGMKGNYWAFSPKKNVSGQVSWIQDRIIEGLKKYMTKVVVIDHIDFLTPNDLNNRDNETIILKKIATQLKQLAVTLDISIILMAHVRKIPTGREAEMSDISSSSGIFQLADYVLLTQRIKEKRGLSGLDEGDQLFTNRNKMKLVKNRMTGHTIYFHADMIDGKFVEVNG